MRLIDINTNPTRRQLSQFAVALSFVVPAVTWLTVASTTAVGVAVLSALTMVALAFRLPALFRIPFIALSLLLAPLGIVIGELAMLTIYFGILFPISVCLRALGRDALQLTIDRSARTYWQRKPVPQDPKSYFRRH